MKKKDGITVVELLIAMAMIATAMTVILGLLAKGAFIWRESQNKIEVQQSVLLGIDFLVKELELTTDDSVTIYSANNPCLTQNGNNTTFAGISYLSSKNKNGDLIYDEDTGSPLWQKFQTVYFDNKGNLRTTKPLYISGSGSIETFSLNAVPNHIILIREGESNSSGSLFEVDPENDKIIARNLTSFVPQLIEKQISLSITAKKPFSNKTFATTLETKVPLLFGKREE